MGFFAKFCWFHGGCDHKSNSRSPSGMTNKKGKSNSNGNSNSNSNSNSRSPSGMTTREATAKATTGNSRFLRSAAE
jgi:hypothetical protein